MAANYRSYQTNHKFIFFVLFPMTARRKQILVFILWSWSHLIFCTDAWQCSTNDECQWFQWTKRASYWFASWIPIEKLWIVDGGSLFWNIQFCHYNNGSRCSININSNRNPWTTMWLLIWLPTFPSFFVLDIFFFIFSIWSSIFENLHKTDCIPMLDASRLLLHAYVWFDRLVHVECAVQSVEIPLYQLITIQCYVLFIESTVCVVLCSAIQLVMLIHLLYMKSWIPKSAYNCNQIVNKVDTCIQTHTFYCQEPKCRWRKTNIYGITTLLYGLVYWILMIIYMAVLKPCMEPTESVFLNWHWQNRPFSVKS